MHSNQDLVSVIMSVYNDEENIGNAIKSILNQTYKNLEIYMKMVNMKMCIITN